MRIGLFALALFAYGCCVGYVTGCKPLPQPVLQRLDNTVEMAGYSSALARCRELGKDAGSNDVYEVCAKEADRTYGVQP